MFDRNVHKKSGKIYRNPAIYQKFQKEVLVFFEKGIIGKELLKAIWQLDDKRSNQDTEFVINILQRYMIICPWDEGKSFLVPSMLKKTIQELKLPDTMLNTPVVASFCIKFKESFVPHSFFEMLLAKILQDLKSKYIHMTGNSKASLKVDKQYLTRTEAIFNLRTTGFERNKDVCFRIFSGSKTTVTSEDSKETDERLTVDVLSCPPEHCALVLHIVKALTKSINELRYKNLTSMLYVKHGNERYSIDKVGKSLNENLDEMIGTLQLR